ncbi:Porin [Candidatus Electrothrix laxa]
MKKISYIAAALILVVQSGAVRAEDEASLRNKLYDDYGIEALGFAETRWGVRLVDDENEDTLSIGEARVQVQLDRDFDSFQVHFKGDLLADAVTEELEADIRNLSLSFSPSDMVDIKLGRMVSTWGTGDLVFINDMFPKDWQSFFIGRDDEYLKQASNSIRTGLFLGDYTINLVYTPRFQGSEFVSGERLSYFNPGAGQIVGQNMVMADEAPDAYFEDDETSVRLSKRFGRVETALYGYMGFWQEPEGMDATTGKAIYPRLNVWGASARSPMLGGIGNFEVGYYDSFDDDDGLNPYIRPSEYRFLVSFERELAHELTGGFQYYMEVIDEYDNYEQTVVSGMEARDEYRQMLTMRLTKLMMQQTLTLSFFVYYSPTDNDGYVRPKFKYKLNDNWLVDGGFNLFFGENEHTFWGRFEDNSNAFVGVRYSF